MFGIDLLQPLIQNSSNVWGTGEHAQEQARKDARYDYAENERYGIQARVEGAKAAGLHPLAALGFQAGAPSQIVGGEGTNTSGLSFGTTARPEKAVDEEMRQAQLELLRAQARNQDSEAMAHNSTRAVALQPGNPPVYPTDPDNLVAGQGSSIKGVKVVPNEIVSSVNGREVGTQPTIATGRLPPQLGGGRVTGLSDWALKQTEDMEVVRSLMLLLANKDRMIDFVTNDIPWSLGIDPRRSNFKTSGSIRSNTPRKGPPRRAHGATGNW